MKHILLIYYIISFAFGFAGMLIYWLLYLRERTKIVRNYLIFIIILTILNIPGAIAIYGISFVGSANHYIVLSVSFIAIALVCFYTPLFVLELVGKVYPLWQRILTALFGLTAVPAIILPLVQTQDSERQTALLTLYGNSSTFLLMIVVSVYCVVMIILNVKSIQDAIFRKILITIAVLTLVFVPGFFMDAYYVPKQEMGIIPPRFNLFPLYYLLWNFFSIVYAAEALLVKKIPILRQDSLSSENKKIRLDQIGISDREQQILILLMEGKTYKEIASVLYVSEGTVKQHTHNIYQKAGVKNRAELIHLFTEN